MALSGVSEKVDSHIKSVLVKIGLIPEWMLTRTDLCKHKHSCYENIVTGLYQTFIQMYGIKLVLNNIWYLANPRKLIKNLASIKS